MASLLGLPLGVRKNSFVVTCSAETPCRQLICMDVRKRSWVNSLSGSGLLMTAVLRHSTSSIIEWMWRSGCYIVPVLVSRWGEEISNELVLELVASGSCGGLVALVVAVDSRLLLGIFKPWIEAGRWSRHQAEKVVTGNGGVAVQSKACNFDHRLFEWVEDAEHLPQAETVNH